MKKIGRKMIIYYYNITKAMYIITLNKEIEIQDMKYVYTILSLKLPSEIKQIIFEKWIKEIVQQKIELPNIYVHNMETTLYREELDDEYWYSE